MTVRRSISINTGIFFITFTCNKWMNLFEICNGYDLVYRQFDVLKMEGHDINAYVIMPNHVHLLIKFNNCPTSINKRISNLKRFLSYDIVERLEMLNFCDLLKELRRSVNDSDKRKGKVHQVFEPSFDCKQCFSDLMVQEKLDYIHYNPCKSKRNLAADPIEYVHSSAKFYFTGEQGVYQVKHVIE